MNVADKTVEALEKAERLAKKALKNREFILLSKLSKAIVDLDYVCGMLHLEDCEDLDEVPRSWSAQIPTLLADGNYDEAKSLIDDIKAVDKAVKAYYYIKHINK